MPADYTGFSGALLRAARKRRNLPIAVLARAAGKSESAISRYEADKVVPSPETIRSLAAVLGTGVRELLSVPDIAKMRRGKGESEREFWQRKFDADPDVIRTKRGTIRVLHRPGESREAYEARHLAAAPPPSGELKLLIRAAADRYWQQRAEEERARRREKRQRRKGNAA